MSKLSREVARAAVFETYEQLGVDAAKGAGSTRDLFIRVAKDAALGLVDEDNAAEIYELFSKAVVGRGVKKNSSAVKISNLRQAIRAAKLPRVNFIRAIEAACTTHAKETRERKVRSLWETLVAMARRQLDHPTKPLSDSDVKVCLKPFKSSKPVATAVAAIKRLSDEEAYEVLLTLRQRLNARP